MVHPLAVLIDELANKAGAARQVFDEFQHEPAQPEILPVKSAADLIVARLRVAFLYREVPREEFRRAVDRPYGKRNVIKTHSHILSHLTNHFLSAEREGRRRPTHRRTTLHGPAGLA